MAGETPGADAAAKRRFKAKQAASRSADKYYASGDVSALGRTPPREGNPTPTQRPDDRAADKYYANGGSSRVRGRAVPGRGPGRLVVASPDKIAPTLRAAVDRAAAVTVYVDGDSALMRRTRAALDLMVTREEITEDQARDVRLAYAAAQAAPAPRPAAAVPVDAGDDVDPAAFLAADAPDETMSVEATPTVPVDTTGDPPGRRAAAEGVGEDGEDD